MGRKGNDPVSCDLPADGHPVDLYHATSALSSVRKEGLKLRCEVDNKCGLGGNENEMISFTLDSNVARVIVKETRRLIDISKGKYDWKSIEELVRQDRLGARCILPPEHGETTGQDLWRNIVKLYGVKRVDDKYKMFEVYRVSYLIDRELRGGEMNPVFFSVDVEDFEKMDVGDLGIVEAIGYLPYPVEKLLAISRRVESGRNFSTAEYEMVNPRDGCYEIVGGELKEIRMRKGMFNVTRVVEA